VTGDESRLHTLFEYADVATAIDKEKWWEGAIRLAWEEIKAPRAAVHLAEEAIRPHSAFP
jgi:hypothetical protein